MPYSTVDTRLRKRLVRSHLLCIHQCHLLAQPTQPLRSQPFQTSQAIKASSKVEHQIALQVVVMALDILCLRIRLLRAVTFTMKPCSSQPQLFKPYRFAQLRENDLVLLDRPLIYLAINIRGAKTWRANREHI